jgi:hypothetical protein
MKRKSNARKERMAVSVAGPDPRLRATTNVSSRKMSNTFSTPRAPRIGSITAVVLATARMAHRRWRRECGERTASAVRVHARSSVAAAAVRRWFGSPRWSTAS